MFLRNISILGTKISITNPRGAVSYVEYCITHGKKTYICIAPVSTVVDAKKDSEYQKIINNSGMTTPDGMPLVWIAKWRGLGDIGRTYGPDLMLNVLKVGQNKGYKHYFYGTTETALEKLIGNLKKKFPDVLVCGYYAPPFRELSFEEDAAVVDQINQAQPNVLWVGLGSPKQDIWMAKHRERLDVPVMLGVGAAFDFLAGVKKQAPRWMRNAGLEWLFRLCCEPRRLWRRYLMGNTKFIYYLVTDCFKLKGPFQRDENIV